VAGILSREVLNFIVNPNGSPAGSVSLSADDLEKIIRRQKLLGYAWLHLRENLSAEFADECRNQYLFQKISAEKYFVELDRIGEIFAAVGEAAIVYKGGALMRDLYADLGTRELKDFDLWVPPEKMKKASELFKSAGYGLRDVPSWEANEGKLIFTRTDGMFFTDFEVHQKNYSFEKNPLFVLPEKARGIITPPVEEHFLMLVIHAGYQHTFTELKWWIDILRFLHKYGANLNWSKLETLAHTHQMHRLVSNVLRLIKETSDAFEYPQKKFSALQLKSFNADFLLRPSASKLRYYWLKHALKQNIKRTLRYDVLWLKSQLE
jgi:hypothetical protein